jgi:hypothetical protein
LTQRIGFAHHVLHMARSNIPFIIGWILRPENCMTNIRKRSHYTHTETNRTIAQRRCTPIQPYLAYLVLVFCIRRSSSRCIFCSSSKPSSATLNTSSSALTSSPSYCKGASLVTSSTCFLASSRKPTQ